MSIQQMLFGGALPPWADPAEDASTVKRSGRFNEADSAHLTRTMSTGNRKTWTWSAWVKRWQPGNRSTLFSAGDGSSDTGWTAIEIETDDRLKVTGWNTAWKQTSRVFRDVSAWYHIVVAFDTTEGTPTDRCKIWINGVQESEWNADNTLGADTDYAVNENSKPLRVGGIDPAGVNNGFSNFYLSNVHFIDGQALSASYFGVTHSTTSQWVPGDFIGSYGTNGFYLAMDPANGGIGYDSSGKANHFTDNNLFSYESSVGNDNFKAISYSGNDGDALIGGQIFSNNPTVTGGTLTNAPNAFNASSANWATLTANSTSSAAAVDFTFSTALTGVTKIEHIFDSPSGSGDTRGRYNGSNAGATRTGTGSGASDTYNGAAITVTSVGWGINQNSATGTSSDIVSRIKITDSSGTYILTDSQGSLGFTPDLVWIKQKTNTRHHYLWDSVRGFGGNKAIYSSEGVEEGNVGHLTATYGYLAGVTGGLQLRKGTSSSIYVNKSGDDYIAWCWKAGGAASSNGSGTITSSVSANTAAGFSIVKYEGAGTAEQTVGHGLGAAPDLILCKTLESAVQWVVYHSALGEDYYLGLNTQDAAENATSYWGNGDISSTVFGLQQGVSGGNNKSGEDLIAYCWTEKSGYSKFGTFEGAATVTVDCGFTPAFLLIKDVDDDGSWAIFDNSRDSDNAINHRIYANEYSGEQDNIDIGNFTGNGFTLTNEGNTNWNKTGDTFVYAAFAGNPGADLDLIADTPGTPYNNTLNGGGNYCTLNHLDTNLGTSGNDTTNINNGNLNTGTAATSAWELVKGTLAVSSGKWYWEGRVEGGTTSGSSGYHFGVMLDSLRPADGPYQTGCYTCQATNVYKGSTSTAITDATLSNHAWGLDLDSSPHTLKFYRDGVLMHTYTDVLPGTYTPFGGSYGSSLSVTFNFGQRNFEFTPPSGYKALNTYNIADANNTIKYKGDAGFDAALWTGTGSSQTVPLEFEPDMVWSKTRNHAVDHKLVDSLRGFGVYSEPNMDRAEISDAQSITATSGSGFTLGTSTDWNNGSATRHYVGWAWAGGSSNTTKAAGASNSSAYLQGEVYSSVLYGYSSAHGAQFQTGAEATKAFDGSIGSAWNEGASPLGGGSNTYIRFTPSSQVSTNTVSVWINYHMDVSFYTGSPTGTHTKVAGPFNTSTSGYFTKVDCGTVPAWDYMQMQVDQPASYSAYFGGIEIGGKLLVDSNVTPANVPSIESIYRVNTNTGFSCVKYTGNGSDNQTIAHGLGVVPSFVMVKDRDNAMDWVIKHKGNSSKKILYLNSSTGEDPGTGSNNGIIDDLTSPCTVASINLTNSGSGNMNMVNKSSTDYIMYAWAEVAGFSKFGSFKSVGDSFVYCGFQPKFLIGKSILDASGSPQTGNWMIYDTSRVLNGFDSNMLLADSSTHEEAGSPNNYSAAQAHVDLVSNGFKVRHSGSAPFGDAGRDFIFAAWAEYPFKYSNAR